MILADCPRCGRRNLPGEFDHSTGNVLIRRHYRDDNVGTGRGFPLCSGGHRVDAGPPLELEGE